MSTFEERLAYLEGRVEEHSRNVDGVHDALLSMERRTDARFDAVDRRFDAVDRRLNALDAKIDLKCGALDAKIDSRCDALDAKIDLTRDTLDQKMSRHFLWLVGIQVTTLVAIVGALFAR